MHAIKGRKIIYTIRNVIIKNINAIVSYISKYYKNTYRYDSYIYLVKILSKKIVKTMLQVKIII